MNRLFGWIALPPVIVFEIFMLGIASIIFITSDMIAKR